MALVKKFDDPFEFSLRNDPKNPTKILWREATPEELDMLEQKRNRAMIDPRKREIAITAHSTRANAKLAIDFAFGLIVGVKAFEVPGPDGAPLELAWPKDKDAILKAFDNDMPTLARVFVREVNRFHLSANGEGYEEAMERGESPNS